ncbi:MAG TPA: CRTAC1 family protein [Planctomycetota bacterium]|nr:CRTAC1 family protein [Planctomycetota bacterium]
MTQTFLHASPRRGRRSAALRGLYFCAAAAVSGCGGEPPAAPAPAKSSVERLKEIAANVHAENEYLGDRDLARARLAVARLGQGGSAGERLKALVDVGFQELRMGNVESSIAAYEGARRILMETTGAERDRLYPQVLLELGVAHLRRAETENCCARHTPESCIMPIRGEGLHDKPEGSRAAIAVFSEVLKATKPDADAHATAKWLLNIAAMTLGEWPDSVPLPWRLAPGALGAAGGFPRFRNIGPFVGFASFNHAGGVAVDDFDGDGRYDVVMSSWDPRVPLRYFRNSGEGSFLERGADAGLTQALGGLNIVAADVDSDGDTDLFVPRGAWLDARGRQPCSLYLNDGSGRFVDATAAWGLEGFDQPSQAAAFADYDGDGDLDLFVGAEAHPEAGPRAKLDDPCRLFRNEGNRRFTNVAREAGVETRKFVKGCAFGDYDGDGDQDLYVSCMDDDNVLYRNRGDGTFEDVAREVGVQKPHTSFPCWFFDYDGDGALDLFVGEFHRNVALTARGYFGEKVPADSYGRLYKGDGKGAFADATEAAGLNRVVPTMGANFGDLDNDGRPDMYLATGAPMYESLTPNVMYLNGPNGVFRDVTRAGGFGVLQKGHGVAFADFDGDGDQDVLAQTGGAYTADTFKNALFLNPGFGAHWINVKLQGVAANRAGYGARIRAEIEEDGVVRNVYRHVGTVGSFGCHPADAHLGLGKATTIRVLEVTWPKPSGLVQTFRDVPVDAAYVLKEGATTLTPRTMPPVRLKTS